MIIMQLFKNFIIITSIEKIKYKAEKKATKGRCTSLMEELTGKFMKHEKTEGRLKKGTKYSIAMNVFL